MKKVLLLLGLLIVSKVEGQVHDGLWTRASLGVKVDSNLTLLAELQYRTQDGISNYNPISQNRLSSYRIWLNYTISPTTKIVISPFSFFSIYPTIFEEKDESASPRKEYRFTAAFESNLKKWNRFNLFQRTAFEYRILPTNQLTRLRSRLGVKTNLASKLHWINYLEGFVNTSNTIKNQWYDQHRVSSFIEYNFATNIKVEFGYIFIHRYSSLKNTSWNEHNGMLYFTYFIP